MKKQREEKDLLGKTKKDPRLIFDEDPQNYDTMRPHYCPELFQKVIEEAKITSASKVLEIGLGTGQATLPFLLTGCRLTGIEIGENMAAFAGRKFADFPNIQVITGSFEQVPLAKEDYDLIFSATAFHWIDPDRGLAKVYDALKEGGWFAWFSNHPQTNEAYAQGNQALQKI
ncbi:MAG: class I SAM-dependent methyltransferase, partial [Clostridiales bacterium]|nr:class I SAM-dependent methyltransferase [Clostridiales bacterium]